MADIKTKYGTTAQSLSMSVSSLANGAIWASASIVNSNEFLDAFVSFRIRTNSGVTSLGVVNVYAYATVDSGVNYTDGVSGTNASVSSTYNAPLIGVIRTPVGSRSFYGGPYSVAGGFGGVLPEQWGVLIENKTGVTFIGSEDAHLKKWQGIFAQSI